MMRLFAVLLLICGLTGPAPARAGPDCAQGTFKRLCLLDEAMELARVRERDIAFIQDLTEIATLALIERLGTAPGNARHTAEALAVLAVVSGMYDVIPDLVAQAGPAGFGFYERQIYAAVFDAGVAAGREDLNLIVATAPEALRTVAIVAFGSAQAQAGDLVGAFASMRALAARGVPVRRARTFVTDFALALAEAGHIELAVDYARRGDDPVLLARVALLAPH